MKSKKREKVSKKKIRGKLQINNINLIYLCFTLLLIIVFES